ncbi:GNAT family N-acetyltransferase [Desemzia sp. RIT804]|uniref:GNAT family N-acetyltransferase n=1 Tax=Desemzia sp. RIT 804 TaxID=2810209 RepID=UPI001951C9A8|nr:GNAT family N-acetyltransferase [Desemzia sp. RIT 804]MBM6614771.1 GNAT family N-acetyltransferase [Desemzia sp. RIT 804]
MIEYQVVQPGDYEQVLKLKNYCFRPAYEGNRLRDFMHWVNVSNIQGAYDKKELVSQLIILPLQMSVFGVPYNMGGIGFVSTYPEYRNAGIMKQLLLRSLESMRERNQILSVLSPFSISFYRHFGWELFFDKVQYELPAQQLVVTRKTAGKIHRFDESTLDFDYWLSKIKIFYNEQIATQNGRMFREDDWWQRLLQRAPDTSFAVYTDELGKVMGYIRYTIQNLTLELLDFNAISYESQQSLWQFIQSHTAEVEKIIGEASNQESFGTAFLNPQFQQKIVQDKMIRIVDVERFLRSYPFRKFDEPLYLNVRDKQADWNNKVFKIGQEGQVTIVKTLKNEEALSIDIGKMSALMMGYHSLDWYVFREEAEGSIKTIKQWEKALPKEYPSFYDYF